MENPEIKIETPKLTGVTEMCLEEYLFLKAHTDNFTKESSAVWNDNCVPIPTPGYLLKWDDDLSLWKSKQEYEDMIESQKVGTVIAEVVIAPDLIPDAPNLIPDPEFTESVSVVVDPVVPEIVEDPVEPEDVIEPDLPKE